MFAKVLSFLRHFLDIDLHSFKFLTSEQKTKLDDNRIKPD